MFQASLTVNLRFLFGDSVAALSSVSLLSLKQSLSEEKSGPGQRACTSAVAVRIIIFTFIFLLFYIYFFLGLLL